MSAYVTYAELTGSVYWPTISGAFSTDEGLTANSGMVTGFISQVSAVISSYVGYYLGTGTYTEEFSGNGRTRYYLSKIPLLSVSSIIIDESDNVDTITGTITYFRTYRSGKVELKDLVRSSGSISYRGFKLGAKHRITYTAGYDPIPDDVKLACMMLISHMVLAAEAGTPGTDAANLMGWGFSKYREQYGTDQLKYAQQSQMGMGANDLPGPIANILRKYKVSKSVG